MTERSGEATEFDPRFDPAFQPGYRPPAVRPSGLEALRAAATGQAARAVPGLRSDAPAGTGGNAGSAAEAARTSAARAEARGETDDATDDVTEEPSEEPQRRNPFVLVLWALAVLITLSGTGMVRWAFTLTEELQTSNNASQADYQLSYMLQQSAPLVIVLGFAVAALTLFLHAQTWNRRRG